ASSALAYPQATRRGSLAWGWVAFQSAIALSIRDTASRAHRAFRISSAIFGLTSPSLASSPPAPAPPRPSPSRAAASPRPAGPRPAAGRGGRFAVPPVAQRLKGSRRVLLPI